MADAPGTKYKIFTDGKLKEGYEFVEGFKDRLISGINKMKCGCGTARS